MTEPLPNKVGWRISVPYGLGAFASSAKTVPITSFLMLYYNQVIGLPAIAVSTVLMASLLVDAFIDPLVGHISDNHRSRWGRRLPFMYGSAIPVTVFFIMLWIPPHGWSHGALTAYLAFCVIGVRIFDSAFDLPHVALIPELSPDYNERTKLFTIRYLFEAIGGTLVGLSAYLVFMKERSDGTGGLLSPDGYPGFAWFTGILIFLTIICCCLGLQRQIPVKQAPPAEKRTMGQIVGEMASTLGSRSFFVVASAGFFISIGSGIGAALSLYWTLYVYQFSQAEMSLFIVPIMLGTLSTSAAPMISARMGKRNAAILFGWLHVVATAVPLLMRVGGILEPKSPALFGVVMLQMAAAPAAITMTYIMLGSMISDLVEEAEMRTGRRSEGLLLAVNSLIRKATQGLGTLGAGVILTFVSFPVGAERKGVPEATIDHMVIAYLAVTGVLFGGVTLALLKYRYGREQHEATLAALNARGQAPDTDGAASQDPLPTFEEVAEIDLAEDEEGLPLIRQV